ncbi:MAG: hemolysin family protein [Desulfobacterales bacterium]|nr:hemolysin family protein [Desulfobacterales bacterium]
MDVPLYEIGLIVFLLCFSGFFSGSETALFSLSLIQRERIKKSGHKKAALIDKLLMRPRRLIVTILVGNDLVNIAASVVATFFFVSLIGSNGKWLTIAIMTPLTLIFAEIIPKTFSINHNERIAPVVASPLNLFATIITPLRWVFDKTAEILIRLMGFKRQTRSSTLMEDDFKEMVDLSHRNGELEGVERDIIHNVFEFYDAFVQEVMTPIEDVFSLPENMPISEVIVQVKENNFSRIPVYGNTPENIIGILYAKDLLKIDMRKVQAQSRILPQICRKPFFIMQNSKVDVLFNTLKQHRIHMAICLDDQAGVSGLVSMEDLLEELFGEIYDEYDDEDDNREEENK